MVEGVNRQVVLAARLQAGGRRGLRGGIEEGLGPRSLSEKQYSKRYASLVECKDVNNFTTKSRLL
jgi:hypothetical protein